MIRWVEGNGATEPAPAMPAVLSERQYHWRKRTGGITRGIAGGDFPPSARQLIVPSHFQALYVISRVQVSLTTSDTVAVLPW